MTYCAAITKNLVIGEALNVFKHNKRCILSFSASSNNVAIHP
jgi:hypothetical protein